MKILFIILALLPFYADADEYSAAADEYVMRTLTYSLYEVGEDQIKQMKKNLPCFKGKFEKDSSIYIRRMVQDKRIHEKIFEVLGRQFYDNEIRKLAEYYNSAEGKQVITKFTRSLKTVQNTPIWVSHQFFNTELGRKIIKSIDPLKAEVMFQGLLIAKNNLYGAADIFLPYVTLDGKCK